MATKSQNLKNRTTSALPNSFERPDVIDLDSRLRPPRQGFRLAKFEIYNWGTFDGAVYSVEPKGETTLLVGENGSGKSTLVDALLTLLVRPQTRNYNVAAGATKNERDERTYVRGAHDRTVGPDGRPQIQYLRSGSGFYSALLACFRNESTNKAFTVCQVLYLNSENSIEKIYAYATTERSIVDDLSGLSSGSTLAKQLKERGFETTHSYSQYFHWLQGQTGLRSKAMDIFNQTVAVKDVQRLDLFIRNHMLEKQPWNERVSKLLVHFTELSETHGLLVRIRQQNELLKPIVETGYLYREKASEAFAAKQRLDAIPLYFSDQTVNLLTPLCTKWEQQIRHYLEDMRRIDGRLEQLRSDIARLEIEIETAGGDRLRQLPSLIEQANDAARSRAIARNHFESHLHNASITLPITSPDQFIKLCEVLHARKTELIRERQLHRQRNSELQYEIGLLGREIQNDRIEAESMQKRSGNLPESFITLRDTICQRLGLDRNSLPFVAELLEIAPHEREWEASIELVLHGFARSLLVSSDLYSRVASYIDTNKLLDHHGQGQRLVYLKASLLKDTTETDLDSASLPGKLRYKKHALTPWVRSELLRRFDYLACETIESFNRASGAAMTRNRHTKSANNRNEKDDRPSTSDRRNFVLGWDNSEKQLMLMDAIGIKVAKLEDLHRQSLLQLESLDQNAKALESIDYISRVKDYNEIDNSLYEFRASQLMMEKQSLEESNNTVRILRDRIDAIRSEVHGLQSDRDEALARRTTMESELRNGTRILENATSQLQRSKENQSLITAQSHFPAIQAMLEQSLTLENLATLPSSFERSQREYVESLAARIQPIARELTGGMSKFLRTFAEENKDLDADIASLDSFIELYQRISQDDLPRHEARFKNRLNETVLHEVGLLHGSLENDRQEVRDKIEQLNSALRSLEWKPGTIMRLEATDVSDREIQDFRRELANCLNGTLDGTPEANEATFLRIEKLVGRLKDQSNERWRDKVIDVRNWFHFAAREIVKATGEGRSYYDGGTGQSGGEKGKLAFLVLVAAIAYQYDIDANESSHNRFHFVMVDEMFSRSDDQHAEYALELFQQFGLQLLIVAPLDAKARVTEPYVGTYIHVLKNKESHRSELLSITAEELRDALD